VTRQDIDWETACNDFHPAFALVRGERLSKTLLRQVDRPIIAVRATSRGRPVKAELLEALP
jgi:hypothetical protein